VIGIGVAGCGSTGNHVPAQGGGSCPSVVTWHGREYQGVGRHWRGIRIDGRVEGVREARCAKREVEAWKVENVSAETALSLSPRPRQELFIANGSLIAVADHPLHLAAYSSVTLPRSRDTNQCRDRRVFTGRIVETSLLGEQVRLRSARRKFNLRVDARTRVVGFPREEPSVRTADEVRVTALYCSGGRKPIARAIRYLRDS
jgi:hypothetical protein